ncbi:MAG: ATP-dependent DNA helicase RecQ [Candidatus Tectomicrobia bacterium]
MWIDVGTRLRYALAEVYQQVPLYVLPMTATPILSDRAFTLLRERFGHQDFRPGQAAIIDALLQGRDVLAVMPTGSGKSLCYQLPALLNDGCTIVISPLIALMQDQVDSMQAQGVAATFVNSSLSAQEQQARLQACRNGAYDLLYVAPERFRNARFLHAMGDTRVSLFAVDEAHCISEWGHDFRPDYLRLRQAIDDLNQPQVLALTATATVEVQQDIVQQLGGRDMQRFVTGFDRPNLIYRVQTLNTPAAKLQALGDLLETLTEGSAIVYAATRRAVEEIATFLDGRGTEVLTYHAGLPDAVRRQTQETFMARQHGLIVATNAFGMGVDKSDVRCVVHFNLPRSMEAYYQEAGRAGRDSLPAECVLLFSYGDVRIQEFLLEQNYPSRDLIEEVYELTVSLSHRQPEVPLRSLLPHCRHGRSDMQIAASLKLLEKAGHLERLSSYSAADEITTGDLAMVVRLAQEPVAPQRLTVDYAALQRRKQHELGKLRRMIGYANARQCRRQRILGYFGEAWHKQHCGACDYCCRDGTSAATRQHDRRALSEGEWLTVQKILSCVARMRGRYGRVKVVLVLMGSRAKEIRSTHLTGLSTYGILQGTARAEIEVFMEALLEADCVRVVGDEFPKLELTERGQAVMRRQETVQLALPAKTPAARPRSSVTDAVAAAVPSVRLDVLTALPEARDVRLPDDTYDAALFERLRDERTVLARQDSVPPYCVVKDRTLRELATHLPTDHDALLRIHGIGPAKADKYGETFLTLIRRHCEPHAASGEKA